jgi:hypothetical protein
MEKSHYSVADMVLIHGSIEKLASRINYVRKCCLKQPKEYKQRLKWEIWEFASTVTIFFTL